MASLKLMLDFSLTFDRWLYSCTLLTFQIRCSPRQIPCVIHPTAIIHDSATIDPSCDIGPFCVIGENVSLGAKNRLYSHVVVERDTTIGSANEFFPFAAIGGKTQDLKYDGSQTCLVIGDRNVFRENTTIHRATIADVPTRIGDDNLFLCYSHVAHDCEVGNHVIMSNNAGLAGHVRVDDYAIISAMSGVHQFCRVGAHCIIGGMTKIVKDVPPFTIADGSEAALRGINVIGLERRGFSTDDVRDIRMAYKKVFFNKKANLSGALDAFADNDAAENTYVQQLLEFVKASQRGITR